MPLIMSREQLSDSDDNSNNDQFMLLFFRQMSQKFRLKMFVDVLFSWRDWENGTFYSLATKKVPHRSEGFLVYFHWRIITACKRSCGNVQFLHLSVMCRWGRGGSLSAGGSLSRGVSVRGRSLSRGGLCPGEGSLPRGISLWGSLSRGSLSTGSLWKGFSVWGSLSGGSLSRGDLCPGGLHMGGLCPGRISVQGVLCLGGLCPEGISVQGISVQWDLCSGGSLYWGYLSRWGSLSGTQTETPPYGKEPAVHIPLECILGLSKSRGAND